MSSDRLMESTERSLLAKPARWMTWVGFSRRSEAAQALASEKSMTCDRIVVNGGSRAAGTPQHHDLAPRRCKRRDQMAADESGRT